MVRFLWRLLVFLLEAGVKGALLFLTFYLLLADLARTGWRFAERERVGRRHCVPGRVGAVLL